MKKIFSILFVALGLAQTALTPANLNAAFFRGKVPVSGGGGGDTAWVTSVSGGTARNNFGGVAGNKFTVNSTITVTSLGAWVISGSSQTHRIGIWNSGLTKLAEVSLNKSGLSTGFNYVSMGASPVTLTAGSYFIGEEEFSGGDSFLNDDLTLATTGVATITTSSFTSGAYGVPNNLANAGVRSFVPPNFLYH